MKLFTHEKKTYLTLNDHTFETLNCLKDGHRNPIWIQCTTNNSYGIVKEYLPAAGWGLYKKRINKQMIFILYVKRYFNYKTTTRFPGKMAFMSKTVDGAKELCYHWLLQHYGFENTKQNREYAKELVSGNRGMIETLSNYDSEQLLKAILINTNNWRFHSDKHEYFIEEMEEKINGVA